MSAILTPSPVSFLKPQELSGIVSAGGVTNVFDMINFWTQTKSFQISFALGGYTATPTWDFTDDDPATGDPAIPGTNPAGIQSQLKSDQLAFIPYWCRRLVQTGTGIGPQIDSDTVGFNFLTNTANGFFKNTDDGKYYSFTTLNVGGPDWDISGFTPIPDTDPVATFIWAGGSAPLYGGGSGAAGTITLSTASKWT